jgi:hypothetical protein
MKGIDFMSENNDFRRQRLSDFLAARLRSRHGNSDGARNTGVGPSSTTPPGRAETSRLGANDNDASTRETSPSARKNYPITGLGSSN